MSPRAIQGLFTPSHSSTNYTTSVIHYSPLSQDDLKENSPDLNGVAGSIAAATAGISELTFEDADEDDQFFTKDLPKHACS